MLIQGFNWSTKLVKGGARSKLSTMASTRFYYFCLLLVFVLYTNHLKAETGQGHAIDATKLERSSLSVSRLLIVTDAWPPYVIDGGDYPGVDAETSLAVLESLGYAAELEFVPWKRAVAMVEKGLADALLDVGYNKKREAFLIYPDEPINYSETTFFCRKCSATDWPSTEDLRKSGVAINRGYSYAGAFDNDKQIRKTEVNDFLQGFRLLETDRVGFYAVNRLVGQHVIHRHRLKGIVALDKNLNKRSPVYLAFTRTKTYQALSEQFAHALRAFKQSEAYEDILTRYGLDQRAQ